MFKLIKYNYSGVIVNQLLQNVFKKGIPYTVFSWAIRGSPSVHMEKVKLNFNYYYILSIVHFNLVILIL